MNLPDPAAPSRDAANPPATWSPEALRADFPILATRVRGRQALVYFDNAATTQKPLPVLEALRRVDEQVNANVHRGSHWLSDQCTELYEEAREKVAAFVGASDPRECLFTSGTTAAINLVARAWGDAHVKAGDAIVLTDMEHHSNIVPWQQLAERVGCQTLFARVDDAGRLDLDDLRRLLTPKVKLVAVTAVSNVLGTRNPLDEVVRLARRVGALVLVDAAQSAPHEPTRAAQGDFDFVAFSGHKMLGPTGVGVLYGKRQHLEAMPPFLGGGSMIRQVTRAGFTSADLPAKFEAGTPPYAQAIALGAAIDYLQRLGLESIAAHERRLTARAHQVLAETPGARVLGPGVESKAGIVSFVLADVHPQDLAAVLDQHGVASRAGHHCAMPLHERFGLAASNRVSFYLYNTLDEVERFAEALGAARRFFGARRGGK